MTTREKQIAIVALIIVIWLWLRVRGKNTVTVALPAGMVPGGVSTAAATESTPVPHTDVPRDTTPVETQPRATNAAPFFGNLFTAAKAAAERASYARGVQGALSPFVVPIFTTQQPPGLNSVGRDPTIVER